MKIIKPLSNFGGVVLAVVLLTVSSGCSSMKAISSVPPIKAIALDQTQEFSFGLGTKVTMPAGEYKPVLEDKTRYFYQAPSKIVARDIFSYVADGGLIVKRGEKTPTSWYAISQQNYVKTGKLPASFQVQVIE